jgi:hypothetical protein
MEQLERKATSASFAPPSVFLQLLVGEHGFNPLRVYKPRRREPACIGFGAAAFRSWKLLTV